MSTRDFLPGFSPFAPVIETAVRCCEFLLWPFQSLLWPKRAALGGRPGTQKKRRPAVKSQSRADKAAVSCVAIGFMYVCFL